MATKAKSISQLIKEFQSLKTTAAKAARVGELATRKEEAKAYFFSLSHTEEQKLMALLPEIFG